MQFPTFFRIFATSNNWQTTADETLNIETMERKDCLFILLMLLLSWTGTNKAVAYDISAENDDGVTIYYNFSNNETELTVTYLKVYEENYIGDVVIPEEVTYMDIPRKVTAIGDMAFYYCIGLTSVSIPNSVTSIGDAAFASCYRLSTITIPNSVTTIGYAAFMGCDGFRSVTIPSGVKTISDNAFACDNLEEVVALMENPWSISGKDAWICWNEDGSDPDYYGAFPVDVFNNATLYVPEGTIDRYKAVSGWKDFEHIVEGTGSGSQTPQPEQCAKPIISYANGKLTFYCETEGAICQSTITNDDISSFSGNEVLLTVAYHISVYATKEDYADSEMAEATLCWIDAEPQMEGIAEDTPTTMQAIKARHVLIQSNNGVFSVEGAPENAAIDIYSNNGILEGQGMSCQGATTIPTLLKPGAVAIVRIGERAVKVVVR